MNKSDAIRFAGSAAKLSRVLGVTQQAVSKWGETMPPLQVYKLKERRPKWFAKLRREREQQLEAA